MKLGRETLFTLVLLLSMLACNIPGGTIEEDTEASSTEGSTPVPAVTYVVIVEDTATSVPTETPVPATVTPQTPPKLTLAINSNCRSGPSNFYNVLDQISAEKELPVIGRSENNEWWQVINATGRECWIYYENAIPNQDFSSLPVGDAPPLPGVPLNFFVTDQLCQPGPMKFSVSLSWTSGGGETAFRLYRDGKRIAELKPGRLTYKDPNAPLYKNLVYEIEAVNENGSSGKAAQIVTACQ